jgi:hypothetical protein
MGGSRSELLRPVAPQLFSTPRPERQRRALFVLRRLRSLVAGGLPLLQALVKLPIGLEREFARCELVRAFPIVELERFDQWGDTALRLWLIDKALSACGGRFRGGHHVTRARGAA